MNCVGRFYWQQHARVVLPLHSKALGGKLLFANRLRWNRYRQRYYTDSHYENNLQFKWITKAKCPLLILWWMWLRAETRPFATIQTVWCKNVLMQNHPNELMQNSLESPHQVVLNGFCLRFSLTVSHDVPGEISHFPNFEYHK